MTEEQMQCEIFQWHWNTYPHLRKTLFHVQQKAKNKIEGARFKAKGVVRGVSDFILICPPDEPAGTPGRRGKTAYIELKVGGGGQERDQEEFQNQVEEYGCQEYYITWTPEETKALIKKLQKL
jgi:hypothetical protein